VYEIFRNVFLKASYAFEKNKKIKVAITKNKVVYRLPYKVIINNNCTNYQNAKEIEDGSEI
jgi:hypothetical protein